MRAHSSSRGIASMILAAGTLVANDCCMKTVMAEAPPMQVLFMRGIAASLWCLPILLVLGLGRKIPMVLNPWLVLRCLCEVLAVMCFVVALKRMPLGDITAIYQTAPLLVLVGASLLWGERVGALRMGLVTLGIVGAFLVAQPGATAASPYALLGFATAIGSAARDLATRKVPHDVPPLVASFATLLAVMIGAGIATFGFEGWVQPDAADMMLMALAGLLLMFGHLFLFLAFKLASARVVAPFYYSFTVWAVGLGYLIFGDVPNALALAGIAFIVCSGITILLLDNRQRSVPSPEASITNG